MMFSLHLAITAASVDGCFLDFPLTGASCDRKERGAVKICDGFAHWDSLICFVRFFVGRGGRPGLGSGT
jgi:hypothetical protein